MDDLQLHGIGVGKKAVGDAVVGDVLDGKTFSNADEIGLTGTLALTGDAAVGDVLDSKTFYNNDAKTQRTGSMPDRTDETLSTNAGGNITETIVDPELTSHGRIRYPSPISGKVDATTTFTQRVLQMIPGNIRKGATLGGSGANGMAGSYSDMPSGEVPAAGDILSGKSAFANGGSKIQGTIVDRTGHVTGSATERSGTTLRFRPQSGRYINAAGNSVARSDANFVAGNIKDGVTIFGLAGSMPPARAWDEGFLSGTGGFTSGSYGGFACLRISIVGGSGNRENALVTEDPLNFSNFDNLYVRAIWGQTRSSNDQFAIVVSPNKMGNMGDYEERILLKPGDFVNHSSWELFNMDVSDISGNHYVRLHANNPGGSNDLIYVGIREVFTNPYTLENGIDMGFNNSFVASYWANELG